MKPAKSFSWMSSIVKVPAKSAVNPSPAERAVAFLKRLYKDLDGYILVAAVDPVDGAISGHAAATSNIVKLAEFIEQCNGKKNLYFSVNTLRKLVAPKATKEDVLALVFLHVDIDPRDGEPFESERTRILALIKQFPVLPTIVIDSGGGYQCFWRLKLPIPVGDSINHLETYNQRLRAHFGADHCWNIDRLMRLPFTWNLPNKIKRAKGRKKAPASVVAISDDAYDLTDFDFLPKVTVSEAGPSPSIEPEDIPDRFWELLKTDPKLKARWEGNSKGLKDTSRSGLDMSLAGMLWQYEFTKEEIAGVLCAFEHGKANEGGPAYLATTLSKLGLQPPDINAGSTALDAAATFDQYIFWGESINAIPAAPVEHAVEPVFQMGAIHGVYAEKSAGKTFFALEMALSVALGKPFLKWQVPKPRCVLYVDGEMPVAEMKEQRLRLMIKNLPATFGLLSADYLRSLDVNVNIANQKTRDAISAALKAREEAGEPVEVLVLDNLFSLAFGVDLNSALEYDPIREWLLALKAKGLCIVMLDHENKAGGLFGTVTKFVNAAVILHIKKRESASMLNWTSISVEVEWARSFPADQGRLNCEFGKCQTLHGDMIRWDWGSDLNQSDNVPPYITTLFHIYCGHPKKVQEVVEQTHLVRSTVQGHLKTLRKAKWLSPKGLIVTPQGKAMVKEYYPAADLGKHM